MSNHTVILTDSTAFVFDTDTAEFAQKVELPDGIVLRSTEDGWYANRELEIVADNLEDIYYWDSPQAAYDAPRI